MSPGGEATHGALPRKVPAVTRSPTSARAQVLGVPQPRGWLWLWLGGLRGAGPARPGHSPQPCRAASPALPLLFRDTSPSRRSRVQSRQAQPSLDNAGFSLKSPGAWQGQLQPCDTPLSPGSVNATPPVPGRAPQLKGHSARTPQLPGGSQEHHKDLKEPRETGGSRRDPGQPRVTQRCREAVGAPGEGHGIPKDLDGGKGSRKYQRHHGGPHGAWRRRGTRRDSGGPQNTWRK